MLLAIAETDRSKINIPWHSTSGGRDENKRETKEGIV